MKSIKYSVDSLAIGRSLLATGLLLTLVFNSNELLFYYGFDFQTRYLGEVNWTFFRLFSDENLILAKLSALMILILVISGYYPQITGILHWYITYSFLKDCPIVDGGDQIASQITLLLIPITLLDTRRNQWTSPKSNNGYRAIFARSCILILKLQICYIYFDAAISKLKVPEWVDGTAVYYWFTRPIFGVSDFLIPVIYPLLKNPITLVFITWGTLLLELSLAAAIVMKVKDRKTLLKLGLFFHFMIVIVHGLPSFFFTMSSCLFLYLLPFEKYFSVRLSKNIFSRYDLIKIVFQKPQKAFSLKK